MAIFLANESLELVWVKSVFPPCLLCVSLCLSESLGGKGLLSRSDLYRHLRWEIPKQTPWLNFSPLVLALLPHLVGRCLPFWDRQPSPNICDKQELQTVTEMSEFPECQNKK